MMIPTDSGFLITGGCGFIGTNLLLELVKGGFSRIVVADKLCRWRAGKPPEGVEFLKLDILSPEFERVMGTVKPSIVVHLAALHYIPYCNEHPEEAWRTNVDGTQAVLDAAVANGAERFFLASTAAVYKSSLTPHVETDSLGAMDTYGLCKIRNEQQVQEAASRSGCRFAVGRIFNVVGAYETNPHLIPEILERLKVSRRIEVGNLESKRDYVHAGDVARGIVRMVSGIGDSVDTCNLGTGRAWSPVEVVKVLSAILGESIECVSSPQHQRAVDRPMLAADNSRMRHRYGWQPRESLEQALRDALAHPRAKEKDHDKAM
jgi:UDP-glucose 4-epimerase